MVDDRGALGTLGDIHADAWWIPRICTCTCHVYVYVYVYMYVYVYVYVCVCVCVIAAVLLALRPALPSTVRDPAGQQGFHREAQYSHCWFQISVGNAQLRLTPVFQGY